MTPDMRHESALRQWPLRQEDSAMTVDGDRIRFGGAADS
jgi:hypothetical protein